MPKNITHKFRTRQQILDKQIVFIDENDFIKKEKGLKRVLPKTFKYLIFEYYYTLVDKTDGSYEDILPSSDEFEGVYGPVKIKYSVIKNKIVMEDLKPHKIFLANYFGNIKVYKGMPYVDEKDKFKIEMIKRRKENGI